MYQYYMLSNEERYRLINVFPDRFDEFSNSSSPNNADILIIIDRSASSSTRLDKHIKFNINFMLIGNK